MGQRLLKNIDASKVLDLNSLVDYNNGQVVSRTLVQNKAVSITLFAFDSGEEIGAHVSEGEAMICILDGNAQITIGEDTFILDKGQTIVMPAGIPHAVFANSKFKMLLTVVFPL
ncbi:MAG: cupin domain-containing protein [Bacillota bacterium]|nr:cupin domain-containing protein [Bacillota bacterium]